LHSRVPQACSTGLLLRGSRAVLFQANYSASGAVGSKRRPEVQRQYLCIWLNEWCELLAYRRLDTGEERAFCRLWSASRAFYLLYRIGIVAVGHVSTCMTHWVPEASTAPLWQLEFRGFGAVRRPSRPTGARNQHNYF